MRLVLASASPQRREILARLGIPFEVAVSGAPELEEGPPDEVALENAHRKAAAVAARPEHADASVLGADTVVAIGMRLYGKPADRDQAERTLRELSGRRHAVISAVCVIDAGDQDTPAVPGAPAPGRPAARTAAAAPAPGRSAARTAAARTIVEFQRLDERLLRWYLESGEWRGRAGGYAIQGAGAALVRRIEGDYTSVVGLPVPALLELLPGLLSV